MKAAKRFWAEPAGAAFSKNRGGGGEMAYFQRKRAAEPESYTRKFHTAREAYPDDSAGDAYAGEYDDPAANGADYPDGAEMNGAETEGADWEDAEYDDGFQDDDLYNDGMYDDFGDEAEEEWTEEELAEEKKHRFRILAGVGDLTAILAGTALILVLVALLIQMINFVTEDISQNFTIWTTKF